MIGNSLSPSTTPLLKRPPSPIELCSEKIIKIDEQSIEEENNNEDDDIPTHSTIINNFTLSLTNPSSENITFHPLFLHQFMDPTLEEETLLQWSKYQFKLKIHSQSMNILITTTTDEEEEKLKQILGPYFLSKFPKESLFFDAEKFSQQSSQAPPPSSFLAPNSNGFVQGSLKDESIASISRRIQPLLLMFIDGASIIDESDLKWQIRILYRNSSIVGYATCYPFLFYPEGIRLRISQFFILPPHQRKGFGSIMYGEIINAANQNSTVSQITVEDPSIVFSDFRLLNDLSLESSEKLTPMQKLQCSLILEGKKFIEDQSYGVDDSFINWRKSVKKMLLKRDAECIPPPEKREARLERLDELFKEEFYRYRKILKVPIL